MRSAPASEPTRLPPQDKEAEIIVLGACMRSEAEVMFALLELKPEQFQMAEHQTIYTAISEVFGQNRPVTPETVAGRLREKNQLEDAGGIEYLRAAWEDDHISHHVRDARRTVADKATLRRMLLWTARVRDTIYQQEHDPGGVIAQVAAEAIAFAEAGAGPSLVTPKATRVEDWATMQAALHRDFAVTPARFGVAELDRCTGGLGNMFLCLLLAMQGAGKTRFAAHVALTSAQHFARQPEEEREHVLVFPLEEGREPWVRNAVAWLAHIDASKLMPGRAPRSERPGLEARAEKGHRQLTELPIVIAQNCDTSRHLTTLIGIEARRRKLGLIVIDYLQRLGRDTDEERLALARVSLELQGLSERMRVPILLLSQMSFSNVPGDVTPYGGRGPAFDASLAIILDRRSNEEGRKLDEGTLSCFKARPIPEFPVVEFHVNYRNGGHYYDMQEWSDAQAREKLPGSRLEVPRDERYGSG